MVRSDREPLSPAVEVDETYIGGLEEGMPGRGAKKKTLVAVATELAQDLNVMGRIRLEPVPDASSDSLIPFVVRNVSPGSTVVTDGWTAYNALERAGFKHVILEPKLDKTESSPHVHLVVSLPKRWINGTFQGSISHSNLPYYLDEFVFRFNRRHSRSRINLLKRLVEQAVVTPPVTRMEMVKQIQGRTEFAIKDR
jgi:transposase-like protein